MENDVFQIRLNKSGDKVIDLCTEEQLSRLQRELRVLHFMGDPKDFHTSECEEMNEVQELYKFLLHVAEQV